jgi:hypothetical protein
VPSKPAPPIGGLTDVLVTRRLRRLPTPRPRMAPLRPGRQFLLFDFFHPMVKGDKLVDGDGSGVAVPASDGSLQQMVGNGLVHLYAEDRDSLTAQAGISDAQQECSITHSLGNHSSILP